MSRSPIEMFGTLKTYDCDDYADDEVDDDDDSHRGFPNQGPP